MECYIPILLSFNKSVNDWANSLWTSFGYTLNLEFFLPVFEICLRMLSDYVYFVDLHSSSFFKLISPLIVGLSFL